MKIYIDNALKCHVSQEDGLRAVETDYFDGKCDAYIEGHRYIPEGMTWVNDSGVRFAGEMVAPWKPWADLDAAQRAYEHEQYIMLLEKLSEVYAE